MIKNLLSIYCLTTTISIAQVGIGTDSPHPDAMLHLESDNSGLLINVVNLNSTPSPIPLTAHVGGIIVYNNALPVNDVVPGFYYNDGTQWNQVSNSVGGDWLITGNSSTNPSVNFLGTTDNQSLSFGTDNRVNHALETNGTLSVFRPTTSSVHIGENVGNSGNGSVNVFIGANTAVSNGAGDRSTALGANSYISNTSGGNNNVIGAYAMRANTGREHSIAIGYNALEDSNGDRNVAIGNYASLNVTNSTRNFSIGGNALSSNTTGDDNTAVGFNALSGLTTEDFNTAVGYNSYTTGNYRNANVIGYNAIADADNIVHLGNTSITTISGQVNFTTYSDKRIKTNIREDVIGTEFISKLRPVTYNFDLDKQNELLNIEDLSNSPSKYDIENIKFSGFIAQEIEKAAIASNYNFNGLKKPEKDQKLYMVTYTQFIMPLVKTIKEQQERLKEIKKELEKLKNNH